MMHVTATDTPEHRSTSTAPWWIILCALGAVAAAMAAMTNADSVRVTALVGVAIITVPTVLFQVSTKRPRHPWVWVAFGSGGCLVVAATVGGVSVWDSDPERARSIFLALRITGHLMIFLGFCGAALIRRRTGDISSLLDALILGLAIGLIAWRTTFNSAIDRSVVSTTNMLAVSILPATGIIACTLLLRRVFSTERASGSFRLLLAGGAVVILAHLVSGVAILRGATLSAHVPLQIIFLTFLGAAAAHPSMRSVTQPVTIGLNKFGSTRIALLALALLDTPIVILLDHGRLDSDNAALLIGACVMSVIVVIRLISLAREMEATRLRERRREERFEALVQNSSDLIVVVDRDHRVTYASPSVDSVMGYRPADLTDQRVLRGIHPDDRASVKDALDSLQKGSTSDLEVFRLLHADQSWRWVEARAVNLTEDPTVAGIVVNCRDVTERIIAQAVIDDSIARQSAVAELGRVALSAPDAHVLTERTAALARSTLDVQSCEVVLFEGDVIADAVIARTGCIEPLGDAARPGPWIIDACRDAQSPVQFDDPDTGGPLRTSTALVFSPLDAPVARPERMIPDEYISTVARVMAVRVADREHILGAILVRSGTPRSFNQDEAAFLSTMAGTLGLALGRREAESAARHQALHDTLTGLPNRALFVDRLTHSLERLSRTGEHVAVLFLDIDHFKVVNDSLGHSVGDRVLTEVAERLRALIRPGDTVARFGGDEFTILLDPLRDQLEAEHIAERIRAEVARATTAGTAGLQPTASVGIAIATAGSSNAETLLRDADAAMYQAKDRGRNGVAVFDDTMRDKVIHRLRTEIDLPRAIAGDQLVMHYQPIISLTDGTMQGVEALVRWNHPDLGLIQPDQFIPVAELSGLIGDLDRWVLHAVMRQCAQDNASSGGAGRWFALNVSARTITAATFPALVAETLMATGAPAEKICIEVTESALMNDMDRSSAVLSALRDLGVGISVDDFGTGYSSLTYLKQLPATTLKIDGSFTAGIGRPGRDRAIVESVVKLAATLHMTAVAEGVETGIQRDVLVEMGCPMGQGYYFGRPAPAVDLPVMPVTAHLEPVAPSLAEVAPVHKGAS